MTNTLKMNPNPVTENGLKELKDKYENLKSVQRPLAIKELQDARAHGDLSENAEYDAAKAKQRKIEKEISILEGKIRTAQVINMTSKDTIIFGAVVTLENKDKTKQEHKIVGIDEAQSDLTGYKISIISPLARSLIGKKKGQEVEVQTSENNSYKIINFKYE